MVARKNRKAELGVPPGTAVHQEKGGRDRWIRNPTVIKWLSRARGIGREFWRGFSSPLLSSGSLFQLCCVPFFLFFVFLFAGWEGVIDQSIMISAGGLALLATLPVWALISICLAPFRNHYAERAEGCWKGSRFIYHQRQHLFTYEWSASDNGTGQAYRIRGIPKDSLVDYVMEVEGPAHLIRCMLVGRFYLHPVAPVLLLWRPALRGSVRLRRGNRLHLYCYSEASALPIIVRVYAVAFDVRPEVLMYYTDDRIAASIAVKDGQESSEIDDGREPKNKPQPKAA